MDPRINAACDWLNERTGQQYQVEGESVVNFSKPLYEESYEIPADMDRFVRVLIDACADDEMLHIGREIYAEHGCYPGGSAAIAYALRKTPADLFTAFCAVCLKEGR